MPPYDQFIVMGPVRCDEICRAIKQRLGEGASQTVGQLPRVRRALRQASALRIPKLSASYSECNSLSQASKLP